MGPQRPNRPQPTERRSLTNALHRALLLLASIAAIGHSGTKAQDDARPLALTAQLEGDAISPGTERYLLRALSMAESREADVFVLQLDTPGGLLESTRRLVKSFLASEIPVVVYVAPAGSRAASAGVFLTLAAHVAAMAPGTTIGAAHPVSVGGLPIGPSQDSEEPGDSDSGGAMLDKIVNDTASWARSIAERRGRDADWAERTVRESLSVTAAEALDAGVVDLIADDLEDLLESIDGREVDLVLGQRELHTSGARIEEVPMWWGEGLLGLIANPNVAFLLLLFGFYGIVFELTSPGFGVPGVLGVICFLLAMFGLSMLPVSWLGLGLIALALGLFGAEVFVTSFGLLGLAGAVCLVFGGLMLVDSPAGFARVSWAAAVPGSAATALITVFLVTNVVRAHRRRPTGGSESLLEERAQALEDFARSGEGFAGHVLVHGERWSARSDVPIRSGDPCSVARRDGLVLLVHSALDAERHV